MKWREPPSVRQHAPNPLQRPETEELEPAQAEQHLKEVDAQHDAFRVEQTGVGTPTQADAVEQKHADDRLADVACQGHAAGGGKRLPERALFPPEVEQAKTCRVGKACGVDTEQIEQAVDSQAPRMAILATPGINQRQWKPDEQAVAAQPEKPCFAFFQGSIYLLAADVEAYEEEPHHFEIAVAVDEFLNAHQGSLYEKLEDGLVVLRIAQPIGEVVACDAVSGAVILLEIDHRLCRVDAAKFAGQVYADGYEKQGGSPREQRSVRSVAKQGEQHPQQGVEHQDVSAPDEHQVQEADACQQEHAPVEDAEAVGALAGGVGNDDGKPDAEQQREKRIEFSVYKHVKQIAGY